MDIMEVKKSVAVRTRNYSLDFLRIVAIVMIIIFHLCYKGIKFDELSTFNKFFVAFFWHFGEIGVNIFMLITGFFLYKSEKNQKTKVIRLIYDIWFFFLLNIILLVIFKGKYIISYHTFFPVSLGIFWYITTYMVILILAPYLNKFIKNLSQIEHRKLLIFLLAIFSIIPTICGPAVGSTENGVVYSRFAWLIFIYFLGAYISKYQEVDNLMKKNREFFVKLNIFAIILLISFIFISKYILSQMAPLVKMHYMWPPNSIVVFLMSFSIFMVFVKTNISQKNTTIELLESISSHTLGIYLLHDSPFNYMILSNVIIWFNQYQASKKLVPIILFMTIIVFFLGLIVSTIKKYTADKLFQKFLLRIDQKYRLHLFE